MAAAALLLLRPTHDSKPVLAGKRLGLDVLIDTMALAPSENAYALESAQAVATANQHVTLFRVGDGGMTASACSSRPRTTSWSRCAGSAWARRARSCSASPTGG